MLFCRLHNIRQENSDSEGGQSKSERRYGFFVGMLYNEIFKTTEKGTGKCCSGFRKISKFLERVLMEHKDMKNRF